MRPGADRGDDGAGLKKLILAVVDTVDGLVEEPPPELTLYLQIRDWGAPWEGGFMKMPAALFTRLRLVRNVYNAWSNYTAAADRVAWLRTHPGGSEIVGMVKSLRYEQAVEHSRMERFEIWQTGG